MPTTKVTKLQVIAIYTSNMANAVSFYVEHLGFDECGEYPPGKLLSSGDITIYLEESQNTSNELILPKLMPVFGSTSIEESYKKLKEAGVTIYSELESFGPEYANFQILDPDNNVIEFAGHP